MFNKICILGLLLVYSFGYSKELLWNRDFEIGTTDHWSIGRPKILKFEIEKQNIFNGKNSALISLPGGVVSISYVSQRIPVSPNTIYMASGYFYDADFDHEIGYAYIEILWFNNGQKVSYNRSLSTTLNSTNWQFLTTGRVQSPPNANFAEFRIIVNKINISEFPKKIYIDDLSFQEIGKVQSSNMFEPKNYPNPFNPRPPKLEKTLIHIPQNILGNKLEIRIYSLSGDKINTIYSSEWNGKDSNNEYVQPGIYFYIVETDKGKAKGKMTVVK